MITTLTPLLEKAERHSFAIPAFNVTNLETAQAVIRAAVIARSPVIVQTSEAALSYAGNRTLVRLIELVDQQEHARVPIVTHLDHGKHFPIVSQAIMLGYRSVHMDASEKPYRHNVALTRKACIFGHRRHIAVQGELGSLLGWEGMMASSFTRKRIVEKMTDPDQANDFVSKTGVDTLAVAVGTAHGVFRGWERIDFKRLKDIHSQARVPLVLHGGSGVAASDIRQAIRNGIRIINVDTELRLRFMAGLTAKLKTFNPKSKIDIREYLAAARLTMQQEAITIMKLFGSARRA